MRRWIRSNETESSMQVVVSRLQPRRRAVNWRHRKGSMTPTALKPFCIAETSYDKPR
jgi:hypothetical protein